MCELAGIAAILELREQARMKPCHLIELRSHPEKRNFASSESLRLFPAPAIGAPERAHRRPPLAAASGHQNAPFKATVFFLTLLMDSSGMTDLPFLIIGVTSTSSQVMGTPAAL